MAEFLRSVGRHVITDADNSAALRFKTPFGPRTLDLGVVDSEGDVLGYVETKWGDSPYGGLQAIKDDWLRANLGIRIDVVFGGG